MNEIIIEKKTKGKERESYSKFVYFTYLSYFYRVCGNSNANVGVVQFYDV